MDNFDGIGESCTDAIRRWLAGTDTGDFAGEFQDQRYSVSEARMMVAGAPNFVAAAALLQAWFTDRLTVDPGVSGPFTSVAVTLLGNGLELVNWYQVAEEVRDRSTPP